MRLKYWLLLMLLVIVPCVNATNEHVHPQKNGGEIISTENSLRGITSCAIELMNNSAAKINVYGEFDNGSSLRFVMTPHDILHRISLRYSGYCHNGMYIRLSQSGGRTIYAGLVRANTRIKITSTFFDRLKTEQSRVK